MGKEALNEDKPMLPPNVKPINKAKSLWGTSFKVCFVVSDNGFSQIFYNCSNVEEIFSWHN